MRALRLAAVSAVVAALAALPGPARAREGDEPVAFGLAGYLALQRLNLGQLNQALTQAPDLPPYGWSAGYGVVFLPASGWGFASSDGTFRWESRSGDTLSRLEIGHVQIGLVRRVLSRDRAAVTAGALVGLGSAELELVGSKPSVSPPGFDEFTMNRFTRHLLTLEVQLGLAWRVGPVGLLMVSAGYLVGTDFWSPGWAHPSGEVLPGLPGLLSGPGVRAALVVGGG
ncbi:MAG: hypothetical protein AB1609_16780 [Bacillota bacterium]